LLVAKDWNVSNLKIRGVQHKDLHMPTLNSHKWEENSYSDKKEALIQPTLTAPRN